MSKTTRLYYGLDAAGSPLYWTLKVKNAVKGVSINSTVQHALKGSAGLSIGCRFSLAAQDDEAKFDHPVLMAAFTKTVCLIVTKIRKGVPSDCVRYRHSYGKDIDLNDTGVSQKLAKDHPTLMAKKFKLRPYKTQANHWKPEYGRPQGSRAKPTMMRGDLARMEKAGLLHKGVTRLLHEDWQAA